MINLPMNVVGCMVTDQLNNGSFSKKTNNYDISKILQGLTGGQQSQSFNQSPQSFNQSPQSFNQSPQSFNQSPQSFNQSPQSFNQSPQSFNQSPVVRQRNFGNGVKLSKGQKISFEQMCPGLNIVHVGLGWDLGRNGQNYDLDVDVFMLGADGKVVGDDWFVFYNQPVSPDRSVQLLCDSTTGAGDGDDEIVEVQLIKVNPLVQKMVFIVSINEAKQHGYNFSNVDNAYVRITDVKTGNEIARFQLTDYYSNVNSMVVGEIYKHNGQWKFNPVGDGVSADLMDLCVRYGVNVEG